MVSKAHVTIYRSEQLSSVKKAGRSHPPGRNGSTPSLFRRIFIGSSYEGDLMKFASTRYTLGREGPRQCRESLAGRQDLVPGVRNFHIDVYAEGLLSNLRTTQVRLTCRLKNNST